MKGKTPLKVALRWIAVLGIILTVSVNTYSQNKPDQTGYAPVNGLKMYYEVYGKGKPIVLLHGAYMTIPMNWSALIPELVKTRQVIAVELQGHGRTVDINRPFSYASWADDVAGLLKHLKLDSADILGYSLGGTVAFQLALKYPTLVSKLIIVSTVFKYTGWTQSVRDALKTFKPEFFDQTPLKTIYDSLAPDPKHWHAFVGKLLEFDTKDFDLGVENVKKIKSPVLLIMGDNDGVELSHKTEMYRALGGDVSGDMQGIPASRLAIIPASSHVGVMIQTDKLVAVIDPFLKGTPPAMLQ